MANYVLGSMPSPEDERDFPLSKLASELTEFDAEFRRPYPGKVKNQGNVGKCVGMSGSYTRAAVEYIQSGDFKDFSEDFIYGNRIDTDYQGEGMYPREMLDHLLKEGAVYSSDFLHPDVEYPQIKGILDPVKQELLPKALPHRITAYCRIKGTNQIKSALVQLGPVTICCPIYPSFYTPAANGVIKLPNTKTDELQGYHEMTIFGWKVINRKTYWIVLNSWGEEWGDKGYCYLDMAYPIVEAWSITDTLLPDIVKPIPTPDPVPTPEPDARVYRILVITLSSKEIMDKYANVLKKFSFDTYTITEGNKFSVYVGKYQNESDTTKTLRKLQGMGFRPKVLIF